MSTPTTPEIPRRPLLKLPQATSIANVSRRTLENYITAGALGVVRFGRSVRIDQDELDRFIRAHTVISSISKR